MATVQYPHFNRLSTLRGISNDVLKQFLTPHQTHLESRGLGFTREIDCGHLGGILATPDANTPAGLIESLEICDAVCGIPEVLEELISLDHERDTSILDDTHSHADAVLLTWIHDRAAIERIHNRGALELDRSLFVYQANTPIRGNAFGSASLSRLRTALRPEFERNLRSQSCRITAYPRSDGGHALVILHGDPVNKAAAISETTGDSQPIVFRPERTDLAFYDPAQNQWRISGAGNWLQDIYTGNFARILHEPSCAFSRSACYTLQPLIDHRLAALDVRTERVTDVRIAELQVSVFGNTVKMTGRDLHQAIAAMEAPLMEFGEPKAARLAFTIANRRTQLNATIHEGRMVVKGDIAHPAVEEWLIEAEFLRHATYEN